MVVTKKSETKEKEPKAAKAVKDTEKSAEKAPVKKTAEKAAEKSVEKDIVAKTKPEAEKKSVKKIEPKPKPKRYFEAVGRRKTATCRARLFTARPLDEQIGRILVNGKSYKEYFSTPELRQIVEASLNKLKSLNRFEVTAIVHGGGVKAQAEAVRHGIARSLVLFNVDFQKKLKRAGYLRRDPRMKERKKYGLRKARRAPQWAKR
jgi:small subunit ribosomal protein S9